MIYYTDYLITFIIRLLWQGIFLLFFNHIIVAQTLFIEVASESGIIHHNVSPDYMGGGVAIFDYNNDGFEDIYLTGGTRDDKLFKNNGDGTFTDVSIESGINNVVPAKSTAVVTGDINNDGHRDIFIPVQGTKPNYLFLNNGDGTFTEISGPAGLKGNTWSMGAAFGDVNLDGFLDLYVINYIKNNSLIYDANNSVSGFAHECYANELYINNGDNTFTDVSVQSGTNDDGCALAVAFTDFDFDHVPDLYIANDFGAWVRPNVAYRNTSTMLFDNRSEPTKLNAEIYGMGIAIGDYDRNGKMDYYVTNLGKNVLMQSQEDGTYKDVAEEALVGNESIDGLFATSWGTAFVDYNLDGWDDLVVSNGHIPSAKFIETHKSDPNKLYKNNGDGTFEDVSVISGVDDVLIGRGLATTDYDNDGDPDIVISNINIVSATSINASFYKNEVSHNHNWLKVKLEGTSSNRDAFGTKVMIYAGNDSWLREIDGGSSHGSQSSSIALVGMANYEIADSVVVRWPGGYKQKYNNIAVNQTIFIREAQNGYERLGCMDEDAANYDANATLSSGCFYPAVTAVQEGLEGHLSFYPNPVLNTLHFRIPKRFINTGMTFDLIDLSGTVLLKSNPIDQEIHFNRSLIKDGLYIMEIYSHGLFVQRHRLLFR